MVVRFVRTQSFEIKTEACHNRIQYQVEERISSTTKIETSMVVTNLGTAMEDIDTVKGDQEMEKRKRKIKNKEKRNKKGWNKKKGVTFPKKIEERQVLKNLSNTKNGKNSRMRKKGHG